MAAAAGKVAQVGNDPSALHGYFAVLDHDGDGNASTGFSTRYLHMKYPLSVNVGQSVAQGDRLGWMGSTGNSTGDHLHFSVRYNDDGSATRSELRYVRWTVGYSELPNRMRKREFHSVLPLLESPLLEVARP